MKGVVFNLAEEVVRGGYGDVVWNELVRASGLIGAYESLEDYRDAELQALVSTASVALEISPNEVLRVIGAGAAPILAARFPHLFSPHHSARTFVLTLATIVHPELRKPHDLTDAPQSAFDATDPDVLLVGYRSPRRLCALAEGFIAGAAAHYGELAEIEHDPCMLDGAESCVFRCRFPATADRA